MDCGRLVNTKGPGLRTQSSKICKIFPENIANDYISSLGKFLEQMSSNSKNIYI